MLDTVKEILEYYFIFVLNECFLEMHTHNPTVRFWLKKGNIGLVSVGFEALRESRLKSVKNPLIGHLNINSLRSKIVDLREIILELSLDYFVLSKTKIDQSFPKAQFYIKRVWTKG